jgi:hypothetical protein
VRSGQTLPNAAAASAAVTAMILLDVGELWGSLGPGEFGACTLRISVPDFA